MSNFVPLGRSEVLALNDIASNIRRLTATDTLIDEGELSNFVHLIVSGFAYRYKLLVDGRRQICGYLLPGDLCSYAGAPCVSDHTVGLLSVAHVATISAADLYAVMMEFPEIARALQLARLTEDAILRQWVLNVGQRDGVQKLSSFFCEMTARLELIGAAISDGSYDVPLTQIELADTLGLTQGHVNRILQQLRRDSVVAWGRGRFAILDAVRLRAIAGFDGGYLRFAFAQPGLNSISVTSRAPLSLPS